MNKQELIPNLFRNEYQKIVAVLCNLFGLEFIEIAEDIVSDTFLLAAELWGIKGTPENPTAWLYTVAKNKTRDHLKHHGIFRNKVTDHLQRNIILKEDIEIDLSPENIKDSQLQMMFAICHPSITAEAQIGLSLNILCGFGAEAIAEAFLSNKETIYKRLQRAKEKLKNVAIKIELPTGAEIEKRMDTVLRTIYLLFSEGYHSNSKNTVLRKEFCLEAIRLNLLLTETPLTNNANSNALLSLMCFHSSRFDARINNEGDIILYDDQDDSLWDKELITKGSYYLDKAATGNQLSKYHLEAGIAYWHTFKKDSAEKWENILQLYNKLLILEYSPIAALNRTYALSKANSKKEAIEEAEKLNLTDHYLYHSLLGELYSDSDIKKALIYLNNSLKLANSLSEQKILHKKIKDLQNKL